MGAPFLQLLYKYVFFGYFLLLFFFFSFFKLFEAVSSSFSNELLNLYSRHICFLINLGQRGVKPIATLQGIFTITSKCQG